MVSLTPGFGTGYGHTNELQQASVCLKLREDVRLVRWVKLCVVGLAFCVSLGVASVDAGTMTLFCVLVEFTFSFEREKIKEKTGGNAQQTTDQPGCFAWRNKGEIDSTELWMQYRGKKAACGTDLIRNER